MNQLEELVAKMQTERVNLTAQELNGYDKAIEFIQSTIKDRKAVKILDLDRLEPIVVQFKSPIFEDDFPDKGMKAKLVKVEKYDEYYKLHFDFEQFYEENLPYFVEDFYRNIHTAKLGIDKELYTAIEAGCYKHKYSVYFGDCENMTDEENETLAKEHLELIG